MPAAFIGDPLRLSQVLINLVNNAIKFTDQGHVCLRVEAPPAVEPSHARLHFSIQDSGIGMTQEQLSQLFQAFHQADTSITRKYGGTGLGLTISKKLVEMMGGTLSATSEYGVGSCFSFELELPVHADGRKRLPQLPSDLRALRVLVVDDSPVALGVLAEQLSAFQFEVTAVTSGQKALEALEHANPPFDLAILDYQMPGLNGVETLKRIGETPTSTRPAAVIMVSAFGREDIMNQARKAGAKAFLSKPVSPSLLFDSVREALGRHGVMTHALGTRLDPVQASPTAQRIQGARILLVEDNEINQQVATEILRGALLDVDIACNGLEAVEKVDRNTYHAVLMDVQMPVMDGYTATERIREKAAHRDLPIIAMTAHALAGYREECLAAGMNDYVTKPIDPTQLFSALSKWVPLSREAETPCLEKMGPEASNPYDLQRLDVPGLDIPSALERLGGNQCLLLKLLKQFRQDFKGSLAELTQALDHQDWDGATTLLHTLRGTAANLSAPSLVASALALETALHQELDPTESLLPAFQRELNQVLAALENLEHLALQTPETIPPPTPLLFEGKALLAEDNPANRQLAKTLLSMHGLTVDAVEDGQAALEKLETTTYDVIFLDGHMPRLDGPATLQEIRRREKGPWAGRYHPVVALTGLTSNGDRKRLLDIGFDHYLPKPLDREALQDVLKNVLTPLHASPQQGPTDHWENLALALGGKEALLEFLSVSIQDSNERHSRIHDAFLHGDRFKLSREAHDLKSNASTLGFSALSDLCQGLEKEAMGLSEPEILARLERLDLLMDEARTACARLLAS